MRIQYSIGDRILASLSSDSSDACRRTIHSLAAAVQRHPQSLRPERLPRWPILSGTSAREARLRVLLPGGSAQGPPLGIC